jgi:CRISPR-associated protein Cmr6
VFFDAVPTEQATLVADVMTPHMGKWYESGDVDPGGPDNTPADWHDPVPVPFLVVKEVKFLFAIGVRPNFCGATVKQAQAEIKDLWDSLVNALDWLGAGGKTAVGYGRMALAQV